MLHLSATTFYNQFQNQYCFYLHSSSIYMWKEERGGKQIKGQDKLLLLFLLLKMVLLTRTNIPTTENQEEQQQQEDQEPSLDEGLLYVPLINHQGFWFPHPGFLQGVTAAQHHFVARSKDVIVTSAPKSGTIWLKALLFATVNRKCLSFTDDDHPLVNLNPHDCVPFLDSQVYSKTPPSPDIEDLPSPRLFATHVPYPLLPISIPESGCKIVYLSRDPKDSLVSLWHFINAAKPETSEALPLDRAVDSFIRGATPYGPFWDQAMGYYKESLESPKRVLFMRYEELHKDPFGELKRLAEFVGCPFTEEEERGGVVGEIVEMCGFERLVGLEVNKRGKMEMGKAEVENRVFFRKGRVGDWENYLTEEMAERVERVVEEKLRGSGLSFGSSTVSRA
ncbi:Cytosolic sulfotransferase 5 [Acorus gramineus]|uniref:Sulfotransferase n=1 Tax=Acorus gramineus TaxID=55184 RepID=A0AAV9B7G9_ACOGR|nr:Cytosolic sulfotransferase 5 [Acorus gramineus]